MLTETLILNAHLQSMSKAFKANEPENGIHVAPAGVELSLCLLC